MSWTTKQERMQNPQGVNKAQAQRPQSPLQTPKRGPMLAAKLKGK